MAVTGNKNSLKTFGANLGATSLRAVTTADGTDQFYDGIIVATTGAYNLMAVNDATVVSTFLVAGMLYWIKLRRIETGGITEAGIVGVIL